MVASENLALKVLSARRSAAGTTHLSPYSLYRDCEVYIGVILG